jgi:hypothetical protein
MLYQELLIDDDAFPVAGYDLDRREAYDRRFEGSSLYRGIKRAIVREGRDPFEKIAAQADDLVDDVHAGRVTQVWNEYSKPEVRHLYLPSRCVRRLCIPGRADPGHQAVHRGHRSRYAPASLASSLDAEPSRSLALLPGAHRRHAPPHRCARRSPSRGPS